MSSKANNIQAGLPEKLAQLCSRCSAINFELLRVPTVRHMRRLAAGENIVPEIEHIYPFKRDPEQNTRPSWELGTLAGIEKSASTCQLCRLALQRIHELEREQPGRIIRLGSDVVWRVDVFYIFGYLMLPPGARPHPEVVKHNLKQRPDELLYIIRSLELAWSEAGQDFTVSTKGLSSGWIQAFDPFARDDETQLFDDGALPDHRLLCCARYFAPSISRDMLRSWLHECLQHHGDKCKAIPGPGSRSIDALRFVDVKEKAIVRFGNADISTFEYVALSYVWGKTQRLVVTRRNNDELSKPNSLPGKVSKTIEDAMALTESLGFRYLWVDALCILQDDTADKLVHLDFMSEIYRYAAVTVIAACGPDAEAGLAGVREPRENLGSHQVLKVQEASAHAPPLYATTVQEIRTIGAHQSYIDHTTWATRGWTLQERVVSRRTITVTPTQVYWSCRTSDWSEGMFLEAPSLVRPKLFNLKTNAAFLTGGGSMEEGGYNNSSDVAWDQFQTAVSDFSKRRLTHPGDAHDAFLSVTKEFHAMVGVYCVWGMPVSRFEIGLCWARGWERNSQGKLCRREGRTSLPMTSLQCRVLFPSWSWLGWVGRVNLRITDQYADLGFTPDTLCFVLRNSPLRIVKVSNIISSNKELPIPAFLKNIKLPKSPLAVTLDDITTTFPSLLPKSKLLEIPDDQLLFFRTEIAQFTLKGPFQEENTTYPEHTYHRYEVRNDEGQKVGVTDYCLPSDAKDMTCVLGEGRYEFALLATCRVMESPAQKVAMQIVRSEGGVAYRVGTADILEEFWAKAGPRMELVALG